MKEFGLLINNQWLQAEDGREFTSRSPATGQDVAALAFAGRPEVDSAG